MDYPPFKDAVAQFRRFLNHEGHWGIIGWVFPGDTLLVGGKWFLRPRPQDLVIKEMAEAYDAGVINRLGVELAVLCQVKCHLWCYIYCPKNQTDAERRLMPDGLKLSVGTPPEEGRVVVDDCEWERLSSKDQREIKGWRFR